VQTLSADLLIIGGGAAGANAGLRALELGLDPLIVVKGFLGKSGCSIFAGNLLYTEFRDGDGEEDDEHKRGWIEFTVKYASHYLIDQDYVVESSKWLQANYFQMLEAAGLYIRRDDYGRIVTSHSPVRVMGAHQQGQSGAMIMQQHRKEVQRRGVRLLEETAITSLLQNADGEVIGGTALNFATGEFYAIRARAVVICTGQSDRLATRATGTRDQSGDGVALAYRAGAELQNLEIQWWHVTDVAYPRAWMRLHVYPNPLMGTAETARLYNSKGEMFFEQKEDPANHACYVQQQRRLCLEVRKGLARWDGGYYSGYDHIDPTVIKAYNHQAKAWQRLGLDVAEDRLECGITWHMRQGGIHLKPATMETTVPGLYAAGSVGGHFLGSIGHVVYDGRLAVETAHERIRRIDLPELPLQQALGEEARVMRLLRPLDATGCAPVEVKNRLKQVMWEQMGYVKSEKSMQTALAEIADIRETMLPRMGLRNTTRRFNYGWVDALDIYNMLDVCEVTVHSALRRTESRGPFFREDYPLVDNCNWLVKNLVWRESGRLNFRTEPYNMRYVRPPAERVDFFATNY
jgi:succinate dehydrogenase/fumarate reductase flavoprotein subunit